MSVIMVVNGVPNMTDNCVDCPEVAGKTIKSLKFYEDRGDGCETLIEFTDGTSFSSCVSLQANVKGTLFRGGVGTPEIIRDYEV
jgi:hypothetical protein